jgi:hypothetical protein
LTLDDFSLQLRRFTAGEIGLPELVEWIAPILAADSLDIEESADPAWESSPDETRLLWRLIYHFESATDEAALRADAARILGFHDATRDAAVTYELLPLLLDQDRLCAIIDKHTAGIISRTGFLSVVTESGYQPHVKLWFARASARALERMAARLAACAYGEVVQALERRPA